MSSSSKVPQKIALKQLRELESLGKDRRLAADGWDSDWKTLISTLMSARTTDKKTIPIAEDLFKRFPSVNSLSKASVSDIEDIIRPVNFYKTKAKRISELSKILVKEYNSHVPHDFSKLTEFPGVGRKTANVVLAVLGEPTIGVDTHVAYCSKFLGWTSHSPSKQGLIEEDLQELFPKRLWGRLNWVLVRFGQTYTSRKEKDVILERVKKIK